MADKCKIEKCSYPVENKKHSLCRIHNWERIHGKSWFDHQAQKQKQYGEKMLEKQKNKPKKIYTFKTKKKPKKIKQVSDKMQKQLSSYSQSKKEYIKETPYCEAHFCNCNTPPEELSIHHKKGRVGYADSWARENEVPLLVDKRFFLACCVTSHTYIENHPEQAKNWGYSLSRIEEK